MKRMRGRTLLALAMMLALAVFGVACGTNENDGGDGGDDAAEQDSVDLTQGGDLTIAMVTHGDGGSFWAVAKKGAEDGAKAAGVTLKYTESNNDAQAQAQMI
jgi:simple sugar transport system substrate-binding protein